MEWPADQRLKPYMSLRTLTFMDRRSHQVSFQGILRIPEDLKILEHLWHDGIWFVVRVVRTSSFLISLPVCDEST